VIAGAAVNTPVLARIRTRYTTHGAEDLDAPARWRAWFDEGREAQQNRDAAMPFEPETRGKNKLFKTE
jgi:hypothetical protein